MLLLLPPSADEGSFSIVDGSLMRIRWEPTIRCLFVNYVRAVFEWACLCVCVCSLLRRHNETHSQDRAQGRSNQIEALKKKEGATRVRL